ncbi:hypothetical protein BJ878DRAFT_459091 [Calycina marina]|uniref:RAD52 homolog n=1 Tax=Calycina marina TaxID=1763456 RepID=A0A9P7Z3S1_9HELO|nr:hypothetical protein BJ878DRAFT_459091 [Calycina marina]
MPAYAIRFFQPVITDSNSPGEQHLGKVITNPFEDKPLRISEYTAQEIATLQSRLEKQLGPEYISARSGPGGGKVHYVAAEKCIQLANEVFGFNGWSSQIMNIQVDFIDENPTTFRVSLGLSVIMRVTLRDGTFHEDIGYGHIENCKGKAAAFEKAKKEGTTDGLKRALRNFGNVLGNCIYDKDYLAKVTKIKVQPGKWDVANLHRHADHAIKEEPVVKIEDALRTVENGSGQNGGVVAGLETEDSMEEEFGEPDFDDADFNVPDPDTHPDEVVLPPSLGPSKHLTAGGGRTTHAANPHVANQCRPPPVNPSSRPVPQQANRQPNAQNSQHHVPAQPQTPNNGYNRANSSAGSTMKPPPPQESTHPPPRVLNQPSRILNQPSRNTAPKSAPPSPAHIAKPSSDDFMNDLPPPGMGFFSAKAAGNIPVGSNAEPLKGAINLAAFNPHAESPSIPKTPGVDHTKSKPTLHRSLKHVPVGDLNSAAAVPSPSQSRINVLNPQLDATRFIGAPHRGGSPLGNRGGYKPPTIKRPADGNLYPPSRVPLNDLIANGTSPHGDGSDIKRQRVNG